MKKSIILLVSALLSVGTIQAAETVTCCYDGSITLTTDKVGDKYEWYKDGVLQQTFTTNQPYTERGLKKDAKYECKVIKSGNKTDTGNLITEGNFDKDCNSYPDRKKVNDIEYQMMNKACSSYPMSNFTTIAKDANNVKKPYFKHIKSVSGTNSNILVCDGAQSDGVKVWAARELKLKAGVTYRFSCYVANIDSAYVTHGRSSLPNLEFRIEYDGCWDVGTLLAKFNAPEIKHKDDPAEWEFHSSTFTVPFDYDITAHIFIKNHNLLSEGNDFAIDDIYFGTVITTEPTHEIEEFELTVYDTFEYEFKQAPVCPGETATIEAKLNPMHSGGKLEPTYSYEWKESNSSTIVGNANKLEVITNTDTDNQPYYILSTSSNVCYNNGAKSQSVSVKFKEPEECENTSTDSKTYTPCVGQTCSLSPKNAGEPTWQTRSGGPVDNLEISIENLEPIIYICIVETTDENGYPLTITETHTITPKNCDTTEEATINYPAQCKGTPITLTAQAEGTYLWQNGTTTRTIAIDEASDQTMTCIVTQNNGGITNTITETHIVKTIECRSTTMCNTGDSILKAQVTGDYYEWTLADGITKETIYTTNALTISPVTASAGDILTYTCEVYEYPATTSTLPSARLPMLIATESFVVTITNCKTQATDREQVREDGSITIEVPGDNRCMNCTYRWYKIDTNGNITVLQDSENPTYTYNNAKDGEIFCDVKDDQERISHTQKYIIVTYKPEPESICYDTELTKTLEGETSETNNYEWYWLKNDTEVEFPAEAITIEGNKATLNLEYFVKQTNSTEPIVVNVLQKYEVEVEVSTTEGSNNEGGEENEEEGESDDRGTHRLAQIDELEIYFEQKVTDISSVNDTKKILISDNGTLEEYDDTYFKISDSYIYQDPFGSKVGDMDSHEGHLKFTDTPMNAPQAYTGDRADNKYFVEVDGGDTAGPVFSIIANGKISKGDKYILSFLATDTSGYPTESPADIQFTININNSDDIDLTPRLLIDHNGWKRYTYPFEVPLDGEEVIITLSNYNTSSGQNDFAIDEITFTLDKITDLIPDVAFPEDRSLKLRNSELRNSEFQMWRKEFSIIINQVTSESIIETAGLNKEYEKEVELPNETITFIYDPNTSQVNGRTYQEYKVSTNQYGCEHHVYFTLNLVSIEPMIFFSPNNDGLNDLWLVKGIESAPDAYIMIYDRYSKLLYKCKGSEFTGWDGNYNGHGMVQDDYWYVISIPETEEQISGHFTLKR